MALLLSGLTAAVLFAQVRHLDYVQGNSPDPLFSIWRIAWVAHQLPRSPLHLYDANIFWPEPRTLAYSDAMPLTGAAAAPLIWIGLPPVVVYNLLLLASFVLAGLFMYLFVRALTARALPAGVAAVAFAFYPFRFEHYMHLELLSAFWMPLVLWALHRTLARGRLRDGLLTGAALAAQYLSGMYFGLFLACYLVPVAAVLAFGWGRVRSSVMPLLAGAALAAALIVPAALPYLQARHTLGERPPAEVAGFGATLRDYLVPSEQNATYGPLVAAGARVNERQLFPGVLIVLLAMLALWPPLDAVRIAYAIGLVLAVEISLGSHGHVQPFLYQWVLPFRGLRVPARCSMLVGLSLSILAGHGVARLAGRVTTRPLRIALGLVLCGILVVESRPTLALEPVPAPHPIYRWFEGRPPAAIVDVPVNYIFAQQYMYFATFHWQRLANGYSGNIPESYREFHHAMATFPDDGSIRLLQARRVAYVVAHEAFLGHDAYVQLIDRMDQSPWLKAVGRASDDRGEARVYQVVW